MWLLVYLNSFLPPYFVIYVYIFFFLLCPCLMLHWSSSLHFLCWSGRCVVNWIVSHQNPCVNALASILTVFGDRTIKKVTTVKWHHKGGDLIQPAWRHHQMRKREQWCLFFCLSTEERPHEDTAQKPVSESQGERGLSGTQVHRHLDLGFSTPRTMGK